MTYDRESYGEKSRGGRLGEESVRGEVEEEPSELDQPEGIYDEDLDDEELVVGEGLDDEAAEDDDDEDRASPLAEDAPVKQTATRRAGKIRAGAGVSAAQETEQEEGELEDGPEVRTSGETDVAVMSESERRREFPSVARESRGPGKRRDDPRKGGRRSRKKKVVRA